MILKTKPPMVQNNIGTRLAMSTPVPACLGEEKKAYGATTCVGFLENKTKQKKLPGWTSR